jgi:hypothetical protein
MVVSLTEFIYEVCNWNGLRWHDTCTNSHDDRFRHLNNFAVITATIWEVVIVGITDQKCFMGYVVEMASCGSIYLRRLMKIVIAF